MTRFILIAALAIGQTAIAQPVRYEHRHISRTLPGCGDAKLGCLSANLDYVEVVSGAPLVRERINSAILAFLVEGGKLTPDAYLNEFTKSYAPDSPGLRWYLSKNVAVLRATPPVFSVECYEESFTGGAHPGHEARYLNFDAATGEPVKLPAILKDGSIPKLTAIAETHFRRERKLGATADLEGFTFPHGRFELNDNYGFGEDRLVFLFNRYEIAPYYLGEIKIEIPYDEIRDLLRPGLGAALAAPAAAGAPSAVAGQVQIQPLLDDLAGNMDNPSLSPDGQTLAFDWCKPEPDYSCGMYTRPLAGGPVKPFVNGDTRNGYVSGPRWSPDGKTIAFTEQRNRWDVRLVVRSFAGGAERELGNVCDGAPSWSPDGRFVAAARDPGYMDCRPALFPAAGGQPFRDLAERGGSPAFSPDGHLLAYAEGKSLKLLRLGPDYRPAGPAATVAQEPRQISQVSWTRDGKWLVYEALGDVPYLRRIALQPGAQPQAIPGLTDRLEISEFSADGDALAIEIQPVEAWWRADLQATPVKVETVSHPACSAGGPGCSPDGRQRVFISTRTGFSEIRLANADGTNERLLVKSIPGFADSEAVPILAGWSPDGKWIAFMVRPFPGNMTENRSELYVVPASGGPPRRLAEKDDTIYDPVWSPDSQSVYAWRDYSMRSLPPALVRVAISDGKVHGFGVSGVSPQLSPDGEIAYFLIGPGHGLSRMQIKGGETEVLRDQPDFAVSNYAVGQKYLYLFEAERGAKTQTYTILRLEPRTRQTSALAAIPFRPLSAWSSADERFLYFAQSETPKRRVVLVHGL